MGARCRRSACPGWPAGAPGSVRRPARAAGQHRPRQRDEQQRRRRRPRDPDRMPDARPRARTSIGISTRASEISPSRRLPRRRDDEPVHDAARAGRPGRPWRSPLAGLAANVGAAAALSPKRRRTSGSWTSPGRRCRASRWRCRGRSWLVLARRPPRPVVLAAGSPRSSAGPLAGRRSGSSGPRPGWLSGRSGGSPRRGGHRAGLPRRAARWRVVRGARWPVVCSASPPCARSERRHLRPRRWGWCRCVTNPLAVGIGPGDVPGASPTPWSASTLPCGDRLGSPAFLVRRGHAGCVDVLGTAVVAVLATCLAGRRRGLVGVRRPRPPWP